MPTVFDININELRPTQMYTVNVIIFQYYICLTITENTQYLKESIFLQFLNWVCKTALVFTDWKTFKFPKK